MNTNSNSPTDSRAQELEEIAEKKAGTSAIGKVLQKHLSQVEDLRSKFPLDNIDLLSGNITYKRSIIGDVCDEVSALHDKVRVIIEEVASTIENRRYRPSEDAISNMPITFNEREKANDLLVADKKRLVSCQSLNIAIEMFSELNQLIKQEIEESERVKDSRKEANLLFGNAILVYELTDFVISYIEHFKVEGVSEISELHDQAKNRNAEIQDELVELRHLAQEEGVNKSTREATLSEVVTREKAIEIVNSEWDKYMQHNQNLEKEISSITTNLPTLRVIRASAKSQLNVLEAVKVLQIVNNSLVTLQDALKTLEGLELVSLSPDRVRRLLGMGNRYVGKEMG